MTAESDERFHLFSLTLQIISYFYQFKKSISLFISFSSRPEIAEIGIPATIMKKAKIYSVTGGIMASEQLTLATLHEIPFLADLSSEHLAVLLEMASVLTVKDGQELFHEGDQQDFLYIILEGRVAIEIHIPNRGRLRILTVEPMDLLGWSSMAESIPRRTASARAVADSRLIAIDAPRLAAACQRDNALGFQIMNKVANVVANRLLVTRLQMLDLFASPPTEAHHA
jgi:CRP/FNR family transcriptional regulator, cyclic AMP receptor protein